MLVTRAEPLDGPHMAFTEIFQANCSTAYQCEFIKKIMGVQDLW